MAKDAKVGLLLGLVFIVAIAVVLRGVHKTTRKAMDESLIISKDVSIEDVAEPANLSAQARRLSGGDNEIVSNDGGNSINRAVSANRGAVGDNNLATGAIQNENIAEDKIDNNETGPYNNTVRYDLALPGHSDNKDQIQVTPPSGEMERAVNAVEIPAIATGSGATNGGTVRVNREPVRVYVVKDGDNLSKIALKVYGPKAGKRWVNVKHIYKANIKTMKSMDDVYVGQKLRIPSLLGATSKQGSRQLKKTAKVITTGSKNKGYRVYVVKKGDCPWAIAEKQLGKSSRFTEIVLPQGGHITKNSTIFPGMRLRIPLQ